MGLINSKAEADRLVLQAIQQYESNEFEASIESWQQARNLYWQIKDHQKEKLASEILPGVYLSLGSKHYKSSEFESAIKSWQQAQNLYQQTKDYKSEGKVVGLLANAYYSLGDYVKAIEFLKQSLELAIEHKDLKWEAAALGDIGNTYQLIGNYDQAIKYYEQSLQKAQKIYADPEKWKALAGLGGVYRYLGDYEKSIQYLEQSLDVVQKLQEREGEEIVLGNLGTTYTAKGDVRRGVKYYEQALDIARAIKDRYGEGKILGNLGIAYDFLRNYNKAIELHNQRLTIAREVGDAAGEATSLGNLGQALFKSGDLVAATRTLYDALKVLETLRTKLDDINKVSILDKHAINKVSILDKHANPYRTLQEVLIAQNQTNAALVVSERGRARAFLELLLERLSAKLAKTTDELSPTFNKIQQIAQEQNSTLVEYSIIYDNYEIEGKNQTQESKLLIWVIHASSEIAFCQVDLKPLWQQQNTSLTNLVIQARVSLGVEQTPQHNEVSYYLTSSQAIRPINKPLRQLHQYLIEPIANLLPSDPNASIIFIPKDHLFLVPFPALQDDQGRFLIEQHTILTSPSIQVLDFTRQQKERVRANSLNALVVGNPTMPKITSEEKPLMPLPGAEEEAKAIAQLLSTQAIIGAQATKVDIVRQMPKARLIHLATHGLLDDFKQLGVPGAIALAPSADDKNGFLTAGEILDMKLNAELVVLSACSSGQGKITGDGVIGLSRCLFTAGVPSVIVSLWVVGDKSTQFLMTEFYQNLQQGMNKAQALRQAMLASLKTRKYRQPQSWAAFTLIGEAE
ncbi:MAG: CHAT domain-containing protein [Scytonema hyalinum WJT4-NPBG1]|jgi:CHAT domain-containing protein|nr:CHAT domain-containing protein [Scytonema hyalinum WJT4-NPBG1]